MQATQRQAVSTGLFRIRRVSPSLPAVSAAGFYPVSYSPALLPQGNTSATFHTAGYSSAKIEGANRTRWWLSPNHGWLAASP